MNKKYYYVRSLDLARSIVFISGQSYFKFDNEDGQVYSFENTPKLKEVLDTINELRQRFHN